MEEQQPSNLKKIFIVVFLFILVPSYAVYYFFGFEVGVIFAIAISASALLTGLVGIENLIINKMK